MTPCVTTRTGIRIGASYVPKPMPVQGDAIKVQAALLDPRTARRPTLLERLWKWL